MRIVHTCLRYPPATGGVETYVHELVERTRNIDQNRDVRVLTSKLKTHGPLKELAPESLIPDPMYVQRLHHMATPLISYPRLQALNYYLGHHEPDIIHGYSFWYQPADTAAAYAKKNHLPFIFHPMYYENAVRRKLIWQLYKKTIGYRTFSAADIVVVISPYEQQLIIKAGFPVKRFELIPPGVDISKFERPRLNPFLKRKITGTILLAVGRISHGKGLDQLIAAMPQLIKNHPDLQLAIVGEDFGAKKDLNKQAKQLGIADRLHWLGRLQDDELIGAYQHASLLIHPSHYEAFGIVLIEAMANRTPVIARNTSAIPYVVAHNQTGLLFNTDEELITSISTLLKTQRLRQQLGQAGFERVKQNFTWNKSITTLLKLYDELQPK